MQINGGIQVYSNKQLIATGQNLITNTGRDVFLNWLSHNSYDSAILYNHNRLANLYSGVSLSSEKFVNNLTFTFDGNYLTDGLSMFYDYESSINFSENRTLYISMDQIKNICGMYINAIGSSQSYKSKIKIYYSTYSISDANTDPTNRWNLIKLVLNDYIDLSQQSASKMIRFDSIYTADGYVSAKSFKLQFYHYGDGYLKLRGIGVLQKTPYTNVPCAIGLGSGKKIPMLEDTQLTQQVCKLFVNKQLCNCQKTTTQQNVTSTTLMKLDLNKSFKSVEQFNGVNKVNIVYVTRINYNQYNNIEFCEIGLFYPLYRAVYDNGTSSCNMMFSHGLFNQSWSKTNKDIIDIKYTISITV